MPRDRRARLRTSLFFTAEERDDGGLVGGDALRLHMGPINLVRAWSRANFRVKRLRFECRLNKNQGGATMLKENYVAKQQRIGERLSRNG